ncbi:putative flap endonuclease 1-A [Cocos nucifera]|uniref:Putative flap endonuclease 1-A n=1 Tax=Cocos nucifera TaxID=13894 RepID=A0A8K0IR34_COCNU|nr:putative flap endonuclease 1-A [Cocos nucifera]
MAVTFDEKVKIGEVQDCNRYQIPQDWPYQEARRLFKEPIVSKEFPELKWTAPDEEGLVDFLVKENGFNHDRVIKEAPDKVAKETTGKKSKTGGRKKK